MTKDGLLKMIAESGYNVGYAAKKHLATFDIVEKVPGWLALLSIAAGIGALFIPQLEQKFVSATFLVLGVASLFINFYMQDKDKYAKAGDSLTGKFHELRALYQHVKAEPDTADMSAFATTHDRIQAEALAFGIPKQIFLSDWYAHYKFFWQAQTGWMDEQLRFKFWRDKMPLGLILCLAALSVWALVAASVFLASHAPFAICWK
ncbi:SLATT domain-containing protein [Massilia sp. TWP1-3-3]|uniref:SLATT domain-containing protein n=1 Tax=Massilia sp. TWP1-3-3 TaxID=2804573 RepID=UPI003CF89564